jgi:glycopeptide antibiotics resistance protein
VIHMLRETCRRRYSSARSGREAVPSCAAEPGLTIPVVKAPRESRRVLPAALFVVYLVLLTWIVLWKLEVPYLGASGMRHIKLVPFVPSGDAGASAPFEVVANLLLFVPFGLYLGLIAPSWLRSCWKVAGVVAGASLALEVAQYVLAIGSSDVTDVVVNTAGGLAGIGLLALARRTLQNRAASVMIQSCSVGTVLSVVAVGMLVASPLRYAPPQNVDVAVVSTIGPS